MLFVFFRNYSSWWIGHETIPSFSRATNSPRPESHLRMHMWNGWKMLYKLGIQPSMENWAQVGPFSFNFETIWDLLGPVGTCWNTLVATIKSWMDSSMKKKILLPENWAITCWPPEAGNDDLLCRLLPKIPQDYTNKVRPFQWQHQQKVGKKLVYKHLAN